jgi:hypothetical protein
VCFGKIRDEFDERGLLLFGFPNLEAVKDLSGGSGHGRHSFCGDPHFSF